MLGLKNRIEQVAQQHQDKKLESALKRTHKEVTEKKMGFRATAAALRDVEMKYGNKR